MTAMTETEKQEYLAGLHVGILSLNDNCKGPLTAPIWYDYEPGGELWFITGPNSLKGKLLDVGVRLSLVAQSEDPPYKYVSVEGPVVSIDESFNSAFTSIDVDASCFDSDLTYLSYSSSLPHTMALGETALESRFAFSWTNL